PGSAGPGQKAIDDAWRGRDDGFAALEREAALQWADLIARAFELHALGGLRRVNLMRSEEAAEQERKCEPDHDHLLRRRLTLSLERAIRVGERLQSQRRAAREGKHHDLARCGVKLVLRRLAHDLRA